MQWLHAVQLVGEPEGSPHPGGCCHPEFTIDIRDPFSLILRDRSYCKQYPRRSVAKIVAVNILLVRATITAGVDEKKKLKRVAEG